MSDIIELSPNSNFIRSFGLEFCDMLFAFLTFLLKSYPSSLCKVEPYVNDSESSALNEFSDIDSLICVVRTTFTVPLSKISTSSPNFR